MAASQRKAQFRKACGIVVVGAIIGALVLLTEGFRDHRSATMSVPLMAMVGGLPGVVAAYVYGPSWRLRLFYLLPFLVANGGLVLALAIWTGATRVPFGWDVGLFFFMVAVIGLAMTWILSGLLTPPQRDAPPPKK